MVCYTTCCASLLLKKGITTGIVVLASERRTPPRGPGMQSSHQAVSPEDVERSTQLTSQYFATGLIILSNYEEV